MGNAALASLVPVSVVAPLVAAAAIPLLARLSTRLANLVAAVSTTAAAIILLLAAPTVYRGQAVTEYFGGWRPVGGAVLGVTFTVDAWGLTFALTTAIIATIIVLFMSSEESDLGPRERGLLTALILLVVAALIAGTLTADLVNLFVWFEVAALASYPLTAFFLERPPALEAAFKVLALTTVAGFFIFLAVALLYTQTGAVNLGQLHVRLGMSPNVAELIALGLLVAGLATKSGLVPFHGWLPDVHSAAPGPVSALFSGLMYNFGIALIGRVIFDVYPLGASSITTILMVVGLVSALGGALFALLQQELKRILAYDTISQMGVLAVGLATATATGLAGAAFHMLSHALFKTVLFLCAGAIVHATGATRLHEMAGMGRRMPWVVVAFVIGVAAIAGIPPLNGYVSLGLIHDAVLQRHDAAAYAVMIVAQTLTIAALGRCIAAMLRPRNGDEFERNEPLKPPMVLALTVLVAGCIASGVAATPLLKHVAAPAAAALLDTNGYAAAALRGGGPIAGVHVSFEWGNLIELGVTAATLVLAIGTAWAIRGRHDSVAVARIRSVQTGSVNDYLSYQFIGLIVMIVALVA
jgi:multicomponent Na+:H+ antiporter subunit D